MKTLKIELGARSYPIHIGQGGLSDVSLYAPHISGHQIFIITNEVVAPLYLEQVKSTLASLGEVFTLILPDGEHTKNLDSASLIFTEMLQVPCDRKVTVIALGGGVIGDLSGFSAACYQRGVAFIQVPTTLMSQVDSSVGGKTGVNHPLGKNMVGAFYQPQAVIIDTDTLKTLDDRQFSAGLAEVIKYGLLGDAPFLQRLEEKMPEIMLRETDLITEIIERSCQAKADIVAADEREQGVRALLNLGHTFGHAIENALGYGVWLHGEAVALGMLMAADLSRRMGSIDQGNQLRVKAILESANLPVNGVGGVNSQQLFELMAVDKKAEKGKVRFILYQELGKAIISDEVDHVQLMETLDAFVL
ncbi:MAG: 3-dehydroquinate synthase [Saprospiraceae bacterium]|jgi:3-dehydroquinate synthase